MSEKSSEKLQEMNIPKGGMHQDNDKWEQPKGTFSYALNGVNETDSGDLSLMSNERGTVNYFSPSDVGLDGNWIVIRHQNISNNDFILFIVSEDNDDSAIIRSENGTHSIIIHNALLNFNQNYQIDSEFRIKNGCEIIIYFVDFYNPDRRINISKLEDYYINGNLDINSLNLSPGVQFPNITLNKVNDFGGTLNLGSYQLITQYGDEDLNYTAWHNLTNPASISQNSFDGNYDAVFGGDPRVDPPTSKSLEYQITNIDERFSYLRIGVVYSGATVKEAFVVDTIAIDSSTMNFVLRTISISEVMKIDIDEIIQREPDYYKSKAIEQHDQRLLRANIKGRDIDFAVFQRAANDIQVKYRTQLYSAEKADSNHWSVKSPLYADVKGYMRDEVYDLGIVWVFDDGYETSANHIPGRELNKFSDGTDIAEIDIIGINADDAASYKHSRPPVATPADLQWDDEYITGNEDTEHLPFAINSCPTITPITIDITQNTDTTIQSQNVVFNIEWFTSGTYDPSSTITIEASTIIQAPVGISGGNWFQMYSGSLQNGSNILNAQNFQGDDVRIRLTYSIKSLDGCEYNATITSIPFPWFPAGSGLMGTYSTSLQPQTTNIEVPRWKVHNTAMRENSWIGNSSIPNFNLVGQDYTHGELAYYESEYDYPNTTDCDGERIYPPGKIRYHKMPDTTYEPHILGINDPGNTEATVFTLSLGLKFANIVPPTEYANRIVGWKIVRQQRDNNNRTIIDKGIIYPNTRWHEGANDFFITQSYPYGFDRMLNGSIFATNQKQVPAISLPLNSATSFASPIGANQYDANDGSISEEVSRENSSLSFHSPLVKFEKKHIGSSHIKLERVLKSSFIQGDIYSNAIGASQDVLSKSWVRYDDSTSIDTNGNRITNRKINDQAYIPHNADVKGIFSLPIINTTQQESYITELEDDLATPVISSSDTSDEDWSTLDKVSYAWYGALKSYNPTIYGRLDTAIYIPVSTNIRNESEFDEFGGDCFIVKFAFRKTVNSVGTNDNPNDYRNHRYRERSLPIFWCESTINAELRNADSTYKFYEPAREEFVNVNVNTVQLTYKFLCEAKVFYPMVDAPTFLSMGRDWNNPLLMPKGSGIVGPESTNMDDLVYNDYECANYYSYNEDYSNENNLKPYFPLSLTYDFCSDCLEEFKYRILYSEKSYQEEISDHYVKFLPLNYRDIMSNKGEINDMFVHRDNLYLHTEHSLFHVPTKPQTIKTSESNLYIGTGEFLEVPPREYMSTDYGYAGSQSQWATVVTENGVLFMDGKSGNIFLMNEKLNTISDRGMRTFFENNLDFELLKQFPDFPYKDNPASDVGIGLIACYDTRYSRFIITKKDYKFNDINEYIAPTTGEVIENATTYPVWNTVSNGLVRDPYATPEIFENKSWTISFDLKGNYWWSFHSYLPNYLFNTKQDVFSYKNTTNQLWQHNIGDFQKYYDTISPHAYEFVTTSLQTKTYNNIHYISDVEEYDATNEIYRDVRYDTYNRGVFYNSWQSTGMVDINVKNNDDYFSSINFDSSQMQVNRAERTWGFNWFRDLTNNTNEPLFTKDWDDITYQTTYPIDKVPNGNVINYLKSQFDMQKLRDKYLAIRLFYDNPNNRRISTKISHIKQTVTGR